QFRVFVSPSPSQRELPTTLRSSKLSSFSARKNLKIRSSSNVKTLRHESSTPYCIPTGKLLVGGLLINVSRKSSLPESTVPDLHDWIDNNSKSFNNFSGVTMRVRSGVMRHRTN
ncbi:UNVERIFIED_CONTAM: hypothetical protein HDU68_001402, partial [Siphonaria sp. JEL0065]